MVCRLCGLSARRPDAHGSHSRSRGQDQRLSASISFSEPGKSSRRCFSLEVLCFVSLRASLHVRGAFCNRDLEKAVTVQPAHAEADISRDFEDQIPDSCDRVAAVMYYLKKLDLNRNDKSKRNKSKRRAKTAWAATAAEAEHVPRQRPRHRQRRRNAERWQ
jgi:hypothetical protein